MYKSKQTFWTDANAKFTGSGNKWEGQELDDTLEDLKDSVMWQDGEVTLTDAATVVWDYANGSEAVVTLTANRTLSIINLPTNRTVYGTLLKLGAFTLTLPTGTGKYSSSGSVTGTVRTLITFRSRANGEIDFNFAPSTAI